MTKPHSDGDIITSEYAECLDEQDPLRDFRNEFIIPTKADLKRKTLVKSASEAEHASGPSIYLCGNSLGLQPRRTSERINSHLTAWATKGVLGHFTEHEDSSLPPFLDIDDAAAEKMAPIVGAIKSEVAVMETLTANLHLLMASFYRPTTERCKIVIEGKAFPSDHYAVESQIRHHELDPSTTMILIEPPNSELSIVTTAHILSVIDKHASSTALILLPGVQYYTGQCFDIKTITAHAHSHGITIGWDLAHAAGNVELQLHDWNVDFAAWCNYKYINSGPGAIASLFVHEKHGTVQKKAGSISYRPRLSGWWGGDKATRFEMGNRFTPIPGAPGYQVGNPSALALTALLASLELFSQTSISALRTKSVALTAYLESLLLLSYSSTNSPYRIITPSNPAERGAQLSVQLKPGLLDAVMKELEESGAVVDERKPDVVRVAPAPLYNSYVDVWKFVGIFREACRKAEEGVVEGNGSAVMLDGKEKGWGLVK